jgi:hypothetical protein
LIYRQINLCDDSPPNKISGPCPFGVKIKEHCDELKVPCELVYPGAPDIQHRSSLDFLLAKLVGESKK